MAKIFSGQADTQCSLGLCNLSYAMLIGSALCVPSCPTGSISEMEHHVSRVPGTDTDYAKSVELQ